MNRRFLILLGLVVLMLIPLSPAAVYGYSQTYYSTANDGTLTSYSPTYADAHDSHVLTSFDNIMSEFSTASFFVGQDNVTGTYYIYRGALIFDTSAIPALATIVSWQVDLWSLNYSGTDDVVLVEGGDIHDPLQAVDFDVILPKTDAISSVETPNPGHWVAFTGTNLNVINIGGGTEAYTVIAVRSIGDINGVAPVGSEWAEFSSSTASHPPKLKITYDAAMLGSPASMEVSYCQVFRGYKEPNDQLYVFRTQVTYITTPEADPEDYYLIQILDNTTLAIKAQVTLLRWGYSPQSIYLDNVTALTWGGDYIIRISTTAMVIEAQLYDYLLVDTDWKIGVNENALNTWCRQTAIWMGKAEGGTSKTYYDETNKGLLSVEASDIFTIGIPYITTKLPNTFAISANAIPGAGLPIAPGAFNQGLYSNWGAYWTGAFDDIGSSFGLSGPWISGILFGVFGLFAMAIVGSTGVNSTITLMAGLFIISAGMLFGSPPMVAVWSGLLVTGAWGLHHVILERM